MNKYKNDKGEVAVIKSNAASIDMPNDPNDVSKGTTKWTKIDANKLPVTTAPIPAPVVKK